MNFARSVEYLLSLGNEVSTMKLGRENIRTLLTALGDPQKKFLKVQIAGTNGKGSVCAFLDSVCREAGIRSGLYTSPHLVSITERIKIGSINIGQDDFTRVANLVREMSESLLSETRLEYRPTFFEQVTAIALVAFAEANVELAILETGLGGRLDATTAAEAEIAAITRIDIDHQEYLGETIEEIAAEKAAIIRQDSEVVLLHQSRAVEQVLVGRCREVGVVPRWGTVDIRIQNTNTDPTFLSGSITTERAHYGNLDFWNMLGKHQFENAAAAIAIAEALQDRGFTLSADTIAIGIETARHPGRLEYIGGRYLLDGAHNLSGAKALRRFLAEFETRPIVMIFAAMQGKDVGEMLAELAPIAKTVILTKPENSRAMLPHDMVKSLPPSFDHSNVYIDDSLPSAIARAEALSPPDGIILVTGSLYLIGEVKEFLENSRGTEI